MPRFPDLESASGTAILLVRFATAGWQTTGDHAVDDEPGRRALAVLGRRRFIRHDAMRPKRRNPDPYINARQSSRADGTGRICRSIWGINKCLLDKKSGSGSEALAATGRTVAYSTATNVAPDARQTSGRNCQLAAMPTRRQTQIDVA